MVRKMKTYNILSFILLTAFLLTTQVIEVEAQVANYTYIVKYRMEDKTEKEAPGLYGHYYDFAEAQRNYKTLENAINDYRRTAEFRSQMALTGTQNGEFSFSGANGMGVIFSTQDDELLLIMHNDGNWANEQKGRTSKGNEYTFICRKVSDGNFEYRIYIGGGQYLENVNVDQKRKRGGGNTRSALDLNDGMERWIYHFELPVGKHEEDTRIVILPYAVDCMTEDTVDYLTPAVYEGSVYHERQGKRKGYEYFKNDPLGMEHIVEKHFIRYDTIHRPERQIIRAKRDKNNRLVYIGDNPVMDTLMVNNDSIIKNEWKETRGSVGFIKLIEDLQHVDNPEHTEKKVIIDTMIVYKKPDMNRKYHGVVKIYMEDYHHVFHKAEDPGTCLRKTPYKFLQMGAVTVPLELTTEFFENSEERPSEDDMDLAMKFEYNTANIIEDSLYFDSMNQLEKTINKVRSLGGQILKAELESFASPDGNDRHNMELAQRRANAAKARINVGVRIDTRPNIDTWEHTAEMLDEREHFAEAEMIRTALAKHNGNKVAAFPEIRKYPTYQEVIKPVLEAQCRIVFKFQYWTKKKLDPEEAVQAYYADKHDRTFSNGDYYNMYVAMKDSAELDTLTEIVYNRLIKRGKMYDRPLATYVTNRMALLNVRRGKPDSTILAPYINEESIPLILNYEKSDASGILLPYKQNRPEILLNQAVIFYMIGKEERAKFFVDMLAENNYNSPELNKLKNFINFKILYSIPEESRTPQQQADFLNALKYVEESGPDNKAVLYTEFEDLNMTDMAWPHVLKMADDNPVKWYLMGLLWAKRDGYEGSYPLPEVDSLKDVTGIDPELNVMGYPYYVAYFQKCFETNKNFMRYYFNEGNVSEEMRKKSRHAYKINRIPIYQQIYKLREILDKQELNKYLEMESSVKETGNENDKTE